MDTVLFCASVCFLSAINIFFSCHSDSHSLHHFTVYIFSVYSTTACVILDACLIYQHVSMGISSVVNLISTGHGNMTALMHAVDGDRSRTKAVYSTPPILTPTPPISLQVQRFGC